MVIGTDLDAAFRTNQQVSQHYTASGKSVWTHGPEGMACSRQTVLSVGGEDIEYRWRRLSRCRGHGRRKLPNNHRNVNPTFWLAPMRCCTRDHRLVPTPFISNRSRVKPHDLRAEAVLARLVSTGFILNLPRIPSFSSPRCPFERNWISALSGRIQPRAKSIRSRVGVNRETPRRPL